MDITKLPYPMSDLIFDYLWGNNRDWKNKNIKVINEINVKFIQLGSWYWMLDQINIQTRNNKQYEEIEDDLYCPCCGEKSLFPFTRIKCWDCESDY